MRLKLNNLTSKSDLRHNDLNSSRMREIYLVRHVEVIHHWFLVTVSLHVAVYRSGSHLSRLKKIGKAVSSEDSLATLYSERE